MIPLLPETNNYKCYPSVGYIMITVSCFFFFSSRRRHTRWNCDWSSDVCSSDLGGGAGGVHEHGCERLGPERGRQKIGDRDLNRHSGAPRRLRQSADPLTPSVAGQQPRPTSLERNGLAPGKIGRASCRERGARYG